MVNQPIGQQVINTNLSLAGCRDQAAHIRGQTEGGPPPQTVNHPVTVDTCRCHCQWHRANAKGCIVVFEGSALNGKNGIGTIHRADAGDFNQQVIGRQNGEIASDRNHVVVGAADAPGRQGPCIRSGIAVVGGRHRVGDGGRKAQTGGSLSVDEAHVAHTLIAGCRGVGKEHGVVVGDHAKIFGRDAGHDVLAAGIERIVRNRRVLAGTCQCVEAQTGHYQFVGAHHIGIIERGIGLAEGR